MKKLIAAIVGLGLVLTALSGSMLIAADDDISVELDGKTIAFDVEPEIMDGRTMVPLRKIFEEIGALVKWDGETQTVSARKSKKTVTLTVDSNEMVIDKGKTDDEGNPITETVTLDVPAQVVSDRTLVPVRAISESFGLEVAWDEDNRKVIINSKSDEDDGWKENVGSVNLSDLTWEGNGIAIDGNNISITAGGDYTLTGELENGTITVSTEEKVKLRLSGAKITAAEGPCIFIENADKAYITVTEGTENTLIAENDHAIYAKDNLEIKGNGSLDVVSKTNHAIKASDNLTIENGNLTLEAAGDGIHVNDTFKMTGGTVQITATGDGIDSESIVMISGGTLQIETNGEPVSAQTDMQTDETAAAGHHRFPQFEEANEVTFENSTKGINAEWMMQISGGEITINSASHAVHCQDEIEISGGKFTLASAYEKGISAHGNVTISGSDTRIDITKSTEGIESKNILTVNDGNIKIVSTDDGLNATGGNSGDMMPGGGGMPGGGMQQGGGNRPDGMEQPNGMERPGGEPSENGNGDMQNGFMPQMPRQDAGEGGGRKGQREMREGGMMPQMQGGEMQEPPEKPQGDDGFAPGAPMGEMPNGQNPREEGEPGTQGEHRGNMGRNMSDCLVINGGNIEIYAEDDCLDSNGNLIINGGTIKATNPTGSFSGNFAVIDPDGQTTIGAEATLIFAAASGSERNLNLPQNSITVYAEQQHTDGETIRVTDEKGNVVAEYTPQGNYKTVLVASAQLKSGKTYTVSMGEESHSVTISAQNNVVGTQSGGRNNPGR